MPQGGSGDAPRQAVSSVHDGMTSSVPKNPLKEDLAMVLESRSWCMGASGSLQESKHRVVIASTLMPPLHVAGL